MSLRRFAHGYSSSPIHPQNPGCRDGWDREENSNHTCNFTADKNRKNGQKGMKIEFLTHNVRRVHIILDAPPSEPECDEREPMRISCQKCDANEYAECEQGANERKELEHTANGSDGQCIRQAHDQ